MCNFSLPKSVKRSLYVNKMAYYSFETFAELRMKQNQFSFFKILYIERQDCSRVGLSLSDCLTESFLAVLLDWLDKSVFVIQDSLH